MGICRGLTKIKDIILVMSEKFCNFAPDNDYEDPVGALTTNTDWVVDNDDDEYEDDPVGALATDVGKNIPVLEGEDAERFVRIMEENERKAAEHAKLPPTKKEIERRLSCAKIMYDFQKRQLEELEQEIKRLEKLNAETEEK